MTFLELAICDAGWVTWGKSCYDINTRMYATAAQAQLDCEESSSNLLVIDSKEEQNFFTIKLANKTQVNFPLHFQLKCNNYIFRKLLMRQIYFINIWVFRTSGLDCLRIAQVLIGLEERF